MALDAEDVAAIEAMIERSARRSTAGGLRIMATNLRSEGEVLVGRSRMLDELADAIEDGRADIPDRGVRLRIVEEPLEPVEADVEEPPAASALVGIEVHDHQGHEVFTAPDGEELSPQMDEWLDSFDPRVKLSPHFVQAVNEAAAAGRDADGVTAVLVYDRVRELHQVNPEKEAGDDGDR